MADFSLGLRPAEPSGPVTLGRERGGSSISAQNLAQHLLSRHGFLARQQRILESILKEKLLSKATQQHMSRPERYKLGLARAKLLRRMSDRLGWSVEDYSMAEYLVDEMSPFHLHMSMFHTTINEQASVDQQAYWLPLIKKWQIIGSYAQTEMGHGSNVRGLETLSTWDEKTKEFILHSPTLTASKWWNGSLGKTATHAIVVAQLMLPRSQGSSEIVSYGPHPFVVNVRDLITHEQRPGIIVGDIGPKYGYQSMDNGYMLFNNHRIPHSAFLCRYAKVDIETGIYTKPQDPAVVYGSLTDIRSRIVLAARLILARAVTVAVRYLVIRRQFRDRDDQSNGTSLEVAVLDYPTVQIRVLPLLATTFALHYSGVAMSDLYIRTRQQISGGDFSALADLHATSSGLKSLCTMLAADGIETCRRAMGGHGYMGSSGLVQLNADYLSKPTVEGDNWMITQQTASYLIKKVSVVLAKMEKYGNEAEASDATEEALLVYVRSRRSGRLKTLGFMPSAAQGCFDTVTDLALVKAYERRAAHLALQAHDARMVKGQPWTSLMIQLHELSHAHSQAVLVRNFHAALYPDQPNVDLDDAKVASTKTDHRLSGNATSTIPPNSSGGSTAMSQTARETMLLCFRLFSLFTLSSAALSFVETSAATLPQTMQLRKEIQALMKELRPHAVSLVDAWSIPDYLLDSALGRSDGRAYEALFEGAHRKNPLNDNTANPWYWDEEVIKGEGRYEMPLEDFETKKGSRL